MKDRIRKALVLLMGVVGLFTANAAVSFTELTDQFVLSGDAAGDPTQYKASTSLTIKLSGTATDGVFTLMPSFYIPDGVTLTVDGSGVSGLTTIRLKGGLRGTGTVAFGAGITKLVFGAAPTPTNILGDENKMVALEADVTFTEANGSMEITGGVSLVRWPTCSYTIAEGTVVAAMGSNLFDCDTLTLDKWDLMLCHQNAIKKGGTITVFEGRTLYHRPSYLYAVDSGKAGHVQTWAGPDSYIHEVNVLLDGGAFCTQSKTKGNVLKGDLTGTGSVLFANPGSLTFDGKIAFSGTLSLASIQTDECRIRAAAGSSLANVDITDVVAAKITFEPQTADELVVRSMTMSKEGSAPPTVKVGAGGTVRFGSVSGRYVFAGEGSGAKAILGSTSSVLALHPGLTLAFAAADAPVPLVADAASGNVWSLENTSSDQAGVGFDYETLGDGAEIVLGGNIRLTQMLPVSVVRITKDAVVTAIVPSGAKIVNDGGTLEQLPSWQAKVALWLDASKPETFTYAKDHLKTIDWTGLGIEEKTAPDNSLYEWADCREWQKDVSLRSVIFDNFKNKPQYVETVFPVIAEDDGVTYVRWKSATAGKARLTLGGRDRTLSSPNNVTVQAKCIMAVFSAQDGGGTALMMEKTGRLARTASTSSNTSSKDWPICLAAGKVDARTNGVDVAASATGFTGGWQLVTLSSDEALNLIGLGHASSLNTGSGNGGQSYKELLVFTEAPTEAERNAAEKYLAAKWGLTTASGSVAEEPLSLSGSGTVKVATDAAFDATGYFNGTLDLNGKRVSFGSVKLPFKAADIPSENRLLWVDPRLDGAVVFGDDAEKPDEIKMIYARDNNGLKTADGDYYVTSPYMPGEENTNNNRRVRYAGGWLDFRNGYTYNDTRGNGLFMQKLPFKQMPQYDSAAEEISIAAGFFALDSMRNGGGSLMTSAANGGAKLLRARGSKSDSAIWSLEPDTTVTIDTRLNGAAVEMTDPFSGGKDVMSFNVNNGDVALVKCFGYMSPGSRSHSNNEILGEWLLYSANVPAADRERIEAYLAWKWQERFMDGYGETRDMSVSGAGTIAVANPESLPTLAQDFTGVIELTKDAYAFTLPREGSEAVEAVKLPGQTVRMQGEVTIDLDATAAKSGSYLLMSAADFAAGTTFTLGTVTDRRTREIVLSVRDNALYADVKPNGILLIVR